MFSPDQWAASTGVAFYNNVATQSLRLNSASTSYLYDTASGTESSTANRAISFWFKRSQVDVAHTILTGFVSGPVVKDFIQFRSDNTLRVLVQQSSASNQTRWTTDQVFRDTSAWYHIFIKYALGESSNADKVKIYVNGSLVDTDGGVATGANVTSSQLLTAGTDIRIGTYSNATLTVNGYLSEFNLIDGTADVDDFGELKNQVWIPIEYTGSYGNSGFRLQFNQTGTGTPSSSTIGADTSGNANHFSSSGIVASDCDMPDSPENNFCTLSSIQNQTSATLSEGNLKAVGTSANWDNLQSTFAVTSGKWYWEVKATSVSEANSFVAGIHEPGFPAQSLFWFSGSYTTSAYGTAFGVLDPDNKVTNGSATAFTLGLATNDIIQFRLNLDDNELSVSIDGSDKGKIYDITANIEYTPALCLYNTSSATMNFGQDSTFAGTETAGGNADENGNGDFAYAPPSGYLALCTSNLPEPTISPNADNGTADDYFNTATYSGNSSTQNITSVGFQPDWVWIKSRSNASNHYLTDVVRGTSKGLQTNISNAEVTNTNVITSFNSDGFSLGDDATANVANITGRTYVSWNWKAGGTAVSNTDGSITSSVSANTDAGFSIVSYSGNATAGATVGHGLSSAPEIVIYKCRNVATQWPVYSTSVGASSVLFLDGTGASVSSSVFNNTSPTSTNLVLGTDGDVNGSGRNYIAYCFHSVEGYSKFGSYTGNGSSDGTFIYTGFRPAFVIVKEADNANYWILHDNKRSDFNPSEKELFPNGSEAEQDNNRSIDLLSNGFKIRTSDNAVNRSANNLIYMAFAENPFKYANAR